MKKAISRSRFLFLFICIDHDCNNDDNSMLVGNIYIFFILMSACIRVFFH